MSLDSWILQFLHRSVFVRHLCNKDRGVGGAQPSMKCNSCLHDIFTDGTIDTTEKNRKKNNLLKNLQSLILCGYNCLYYIINFSFSLFSLSWINSPDRFDRKIQGPVATIAPSNTRPRSRSPKGCEYFCYICGHYGHLHIIAELDKGLHYVKAFLFLKNSAFFKKCLPPLHKKI